MPTLLSPKELASAIGASESSLKRWVDSGKLEASKTAGGHRRIALAEAIRFIRDSHIHVVRPEILGLPHETADQPPATDEKAQMLYAALNAGDSAAAHSIVFSAFLDGESAASIFDGMIRDAMAAIGEKWQHRPDGVFIEHRATDICLHLLNRMRSMLPVPAAAAPVAVGGARANDPYLIPSLMAAITLMENGLTPVNLGANTPVDVMVQAVQHHHARIVWFSVAAEVERRQLAAELTDLSNAIDSTDAVIAVGGRFADRSVVGAIDRATHVDSMAELAGFARGVVQSTKA